MALTARQRKRISLYVQAAVFVGAILAIAFTVNWTVFGESFLRFDLVGKMFPNIIVTGLVNTLFYTLTSFALGLALGVVLALMKLASFAPYRWIATVYIEFFRGIPALLVLLTIGFGLPLAVGLRLPLWVTVMVSLGLVSAAYMAETLRAGLQAVPPGQLEAARSLGMPQWRAMVTIVIPQAFRIVLPPLVNEFILLTKDSSLAYVLGMGVAQAELTKLGREAMLNLGAGMTPALVAGAFYLVITVPLSFLARWFEKRTSQTSRPNRAKKLEQQKQEATA